ncbi:MAG: lipid IV(A) 3-deoxy-D-manno-octulosonic acid transferase [Gammaproteobacteria bacterium]|nr:lipid IV(A) 3-deoxy-D-manno-octulosonic acid transferase [Gammaproteobacteria bacterium]
MRLFYTALLYLAGPLLLLRQWLRGLRHPAYRHRLGERLGLVTRPPQPAAVWVHAVSVGETLAALPLIEALLERHGAGRVFVTTTTPTGSARVRAALGGRVLHSYAPYDWPGAVARFLDRVQPRQCIVMETEIWPNLFAALHRRGIPLLIANARLSPRSFAGYRHIAGLLRRTLAHCRIAAQSQADARRFRALGAPQVTVTGNLKFDLELPQAPLEAGRALREKLGHRRPVWAAVSTHDGEETAALAAHRSVMKTHPDALLILVPRHPQRFDAVWQAVRGSGLTGGRRSALAMLEAAGEPPALGAAQVLVGDSMGEMFTYLAAADLAFVGGSLKPVGGHNVLEPAALGLPVLFGPHMFNFDGARRLLLETGAALQIADAAQLAAEVAALLGEPQRRTTMGAAGRRAVAGNRGALARLLRLLDRDGAAA